VSETDAPERPTAVIPETTTWEAFPAVWPILLDEVWAAVRANAEVRPGRNVMLYRDECRDVEVGVEVAEPFPGAGRVVASSLPAGRVVTSHCRRYADIGAAHEAVVEWCERQGLDRVGQRWEVYGHQIEGSAEEDVDVYHLVRPREGGL
jgi:effector-binding domain-containing protein